MDGQVETKEERLDDSFLHHNLIEIGKHVVNASKIWHEHFETERFGNVHDWNVYLIWSAQERTLVLLITSPERAEDRLLRTFMRLWLHFLLTATLSATAFRVSAATLAALAYSHARIYSNNFIVNVFFGTNEPLLDTLNDFLALHLIL